MFDSPFEFCSVCRQYVLLDQTEPQCVREHRCNGNVACPLARYFTGFDFAAAARASEHTSSREQRKPPGELGR
jgi:hypothetical protein